MAEGVRQGHGIGRTTKRKAHFLHTDKHLQGRCTAKRIQIVPRILDRIEKAMRALGTRADAARASSTKNGLDARPRGFELREDGADAPATIPRPRVVRDAGW